MNTEVYCEQLNQVQPKFHKLPLNGELEDQVYLLHNNACSHMARRTTQHIEQTLGWPVLEHPPPYSTDSDYHLFHSLKNYLWRKKFTNQNDLETALQIYFGSKTSEFYENSIKKLPNLWTLV